MLCAKRHKGLLSVHVIDLLYKVDVIQIVNKFIQIHNFAANNICDLLVDQSIELLMDRKRIKGVHHINILIKGSTHIVTKENDSISILDFLNLDDIATTCVDYASNYMACTKHSNCNSNQSETQSPSANKYPLLTQFGIPTALLSPTNIDTIRSILRGTEKLNSDHDLSFMCMNSSAAIFFPNCISSKKAYDNWERKGRGVKAVL